MVYSTADTINPCDVVDCGEHGHCEEKGDVGECNCDDGWEGTFCDVGR